VLAGQWGLCLTLTCCVTCGAQLSRCLPPQVYLLAWCAAQVAAAAWFAGVRPDLVHCSVHVAAPTPLLHLAWSLCNEGKEHSMPRKACTEQCANQATHQQNQTATASCGAQNRQEGGPVAAASITASECTTQALLTCQQMPLVVCSDGQEHSTHRTLW